MGQRGRTDFTTIGVGLPVLVTQGTLFLLFRYMFAISMLVASVYGDFTWIAYVRLPYVQYIYSNCFPKGEHDAIG